MNKWILSHYNGWAHLHKMPSEYYYFLVVQKMVLVENELKRRIFDYFLKSCSHTALLYWMKERMENLGLLRTCLYSLTFWKVLEVEWRLVLCNHQEAWTVENFFCLEIHVDCELMNFVDVCKLEKQTCIFSTCTGTLHTALMTSN